MYIINIIRGYKCFLISCRQLAFFKYIYFLRALIVYSVLQPIIILKVEQRKQLQRRQNSDAMELILRLRKLKVTLLVSIVMINTVPVAMCDQLMYYILSIITIICSTPRTCPYYTVYNRVHNRHRPANTILQNMGLKLSKYLQQLEFVFNYLYEINKLNHYIFIQ